MPAKKQCTKKHEMELQNVGSGKHCAHKKAESCPGRIKRNADAFWCALCQVWVCVFCAPLTAVIAQSLNRRREVEVEKLTEWLKEEERACPPGVEDYVAYFQHKRGDEWDKKNDKQPAALGESLRNMRTRIASYAVMTWGHRLAAEHKEPKYNVITKLIQTYKDQDREAGHKTTKSEVFDVLEIMSIYLLKPEDYEGRYRYGMKHSKSNEMGSSAERLLSRCSEVGDCRYQAPKRQSKDGV